MFYRYLKALGKFLKENCAGRTQHLVNLQFVLFSFIQDWKDSIASKSRRFLHLEDFLIAPVQRLCKYPLLLRELKKFTPESHSDFKPVQEAMAVS